MIVQCLNCKWFYEDVYRDTGCPHDTFPANDGQNNFAHHPEAYLNDRDPQFLYPQPFVIPGLEEFEITIGKGQKEFTPLQGLTGDGRVLTRWTLNDEQRALIAAGADIFLETKGGMPPVLLRVAHELQADSVKAYLRLSNRRQER